MASCAEGDERAFQELVGRHQRWAYRFAWKMVRDSDAAWDVTQQAFLRVFKNVQSFRQDCSFSTWFRRIIYNLSIDYWRTMRRRTETEYQDEVAVDAQKADGHNGLCYRPLGPEKLARRKEVIQVLEEAMDTLSLEHRTAIVLREVEGLSYEEIAEVMECPRGTVMSRLHHARKKLVLALQEHGYHGSEV